MLEVRSFSAEDEKFRQILARGAAADAELRVPVEAVIGAVRERGDAAVREFTLRFDGVDVPPEKLRVAPEEFEAAQKLVSEEFLTAVALARVNIRRFHEYQRRSGYIHDDGDGVRLAKRVLPLARVGIYCPAGTAPLFSSLLMNVIPAQIAGVGRIQVAVPPGADGRIDPHILVTARLLGVDEIYKIGGAQAIAALALGTASVPRVDKIVGPGNAYVAMAKKLVFGLCGIDSPAGPSEIVVIADDSAKARYVAADLLSQLEHGSGYESGVVLTTSRDLAVGVRIEIDRQLGKLSRAEAVGRALERFSAIYLCRDLAEAVDAANQIAPEHLELMVRDPQALLPEVENAGAVFCGHFSPEPVGDYFAGTNHVLPTGGAARYASSLSVNDFVKDISVIEYSAERLARTGRHILNMAQIEGLTAHAQAVKVRLEDLA